MPVTAKSHFGAPTACVVGDVSMVRALGRAGIPITLATPDADAGAARSRYLSEVLPTASFEDEPERALADLKEWAIRQPEAPVLFCQGDHDVLAVSRYRDLLSDHMHFLIADADIIEATVDKLLFADLARAKNLPIPPTDAIPADQLTEKRLRQWRHYPAVIKPDCRKHWFASTIVRDAGQGPVKALTLESANHAVELLDRLHAARTDWVLQKLIEGGEERVVSYHSYMRANGEIAAEFTGRKRRTLPRTHGLSSYLELSDDPQLAQLGRDIARRLNLRGVAKMDFKRDPRDEKPYLLEINPRFTLWHHMGAVAGINMPAMMYGDLVPNYTPVLPRRRRQQVSWVAAWRDIKAARQGAPEERISMMQWLREIFEATINEDFCLTDPMPGLWELKSRALRKLR